MNSFHALQDLKIVLVDDDHSIRTSLEFYFRKKKMPCVFFACAEQALDYLGRHEADLVITDYRLPGLNGLEFTKELNRIQPQVAKILITAYGSLDIAVEAIKLGVHDFIQKPFNTKAIEDAIHGVVDRLTREAPGVFGNGRQVENTADTKWREELELSVGKISHRINNSLFSISGSAELGLYSVGTQDPLGEQLHHIIREVQQMSVLNDSLMSLCREPAEIVERIDVQEIILGCIGRFCAQASQSGIEIHFDENGASHTIESNKDHLQDVIENLLVNSIQELRGVSKPDKVIEITLEETAMSSRVMIADSGEGVDPAVLPKIFHKGFTTKPDGHGLGLHIVKRLVTELGASLDIRSEPGVGTTVEITLPVKRCGETVAEA